MGSDGLQEWRESFKDEVMPLEITHDPNSIACFTDASFGDTCYTGYIILVGGNPVIWKASRQKLQSMSTAESELISAVEGSQVLQGIILFATEVNPSRTWKFYLAVDNTAAIALTNPSSGTPWRTRSQLLSRWHGFS